MEPTYFKLREGTKIMLSLPSGQRIGFYSVNPGGTPITDIRDAIHLRESGLFDEVLPVARKVDDADAGVAWLPVDEAKRLMDSRVETRAEIATRPASEPVADVEPEAPAAPEEPKVLNVPKVVSHEAPPKRVQKKK